MAVPVIDALLLALLMGCCDTIFGRVLLTLALALVVFIVGQITQRRYVVCGLRGALHQRR